MVRQHRHQRSPSQLHPSRPSLLQHPHHPFHRSRRPLHLILHCHPIRLCHSIRLLHLNRQHLRKRRRHLGRQSRLLPRERLRRRPWMWPAPVVVAHRAGRSCTSPTWQERTPWQRREMHRRRGAWDRCSHRLSPLSRRSQTGRDKVCGRSWASRPGVPSCKISVALDLWLQRENRWEETMATRWTCAVGFTLITTATQAQAADHPFLVFNGADVFGLNSVNGLNRLRSVF
jgi:hypothetical protein